MLQLKGSIYRFFDQRRPLHQSISSGLSRVDLRNDLMDIFGCNGMSGRTSMPAHDRGTFQGMLGSTCFCKSSVTSMGEWASKAGLHSICTSFTSWAKSRCMMHVSLRVAPLHVGGNSRPLDLYHEKISTWPSSEIIEKTGNWSTEVLKSPAMIKGLPDSVTTW